MYLLLGHLPCGLFEFCLIFIIPLSFLDWPTAIGQHNNKRNTGMMMNNVDFDFNDVIIVDDDHSNRDVYFFFLSSIKNYIFIIIIIITIMCCCDYLLLNFLHHNCLMLGMLAATTIGAVLKLSRHSQTGIQNFHHS